MTWGKRSTNFPIFGESAYQSFSVFGVLRFQAGVCPSCLLEQSRHSGSNPMRGCQETNSPLPSSKGRLFGVCIQPVVGDSTAAISCRFHVSDRGLAVALLKCWLLGTHQGGVSLEHLNAYLEEFAFRFNRRKSRSRETLLPAPPTGCCRRSGSLQIPVKCAAKPDF